MTTFECAFMGSLVIAGFVAAAVSGSGVATPAEVAAAMGRNACMAESVTRTIATEPIERHSLYARGDGAITHGELDEMAERCAAAAQATSHELDRSGRH
jgi:hypothetical protein